MKEVIAIGAKDKAGADAAVLDLQASFTNIRVVGPVDQVQISADPGDKWLVIATNTTFQVVDT